MTASSGARVVRYLFIRVDFYSFGLTEFVNVASTLTFCRQSRGRGSEVERVVFQSEVTAGSSGPCPSVFVRDT